MFHKVAAAALCTVALQHPAAAQHLSSPLNLFYTPAAQLSTATDQLLVASGTSVVFYDVNGAAVTYDHTLNLAPLHPFQIYVSGKKHEIAVGMTEGSLNIYNAAGVLVSSFANEAKGTFAWLSTGSVLTIVSNEALLYSSKGMLVNTFLEDHQRQPFNGGTAVANGTAVYYALDEPKSGQSRVETFSASSITTAQPTEREHFINTASPHATEIAIDLKQCEYVSGNGATSAGTVTVYTHPGVEVWTVSGLDVAGGVAANPSGSSCTDASPSYYVYVTETNANDIRVYDHTGTLVNTVQ